MMARRCTFSIDKVRAAFFVTLRSLGSGQTGIDRTIKSQVRAAATPTNVRSRKRRFLPGVPPFDGIEGRACSRVFGPDGARMIRAGLFGVKRRKTPNLLGIFPSQ